MGERKLVFLDIDGTLTVPGGSAPPESALNAIRTARSNGHQVFICTGRSYHMTRPLFRYPFDGAVVSAGGLIFVGDRVIYDAPMPEEELSLLREAMADEDIFLILEAKNATYGDLRVERVMDRPAMRNEGQMNSELARWVKILREGFDVVPLEEYAGEPVYKASFLSVRREPLEAARAKLEDRFAFVMQEFFQGVSNGELIPRTFDKGQAMERVCAFTGASMADTIGFGDSMNDLPMIEAAGVGVCMGNGSAELKRRGDLVCPSVEEDGLAWAFARLGLV